MAGSAYVIKSPHDGTIGVTTSALKAVEALMYASGGWVPEGETIQSMALALKRDRYLTATEKSLGHDSREYDHWEITAFDVNFVNGRNF